MPAQARDAHNIYLETLSELGIVGAVLLGTALLIPFAAAWRASRRTTRRGGRRLQAYVVHASVDWDWEMPVVTVAALFCAGALLAAAPAERKPLAREGRARARRAVAAVATAALIGLIANSGVAASEDAARDEDWPIAVSEAKKAAGWAPWSSEPWRVRGEAELGRGNLAGAATSFRTALGSQPRGLAALVPARAVDERRGAAAALWRAEQLQSLEPSTKGVPCCS